jgi:hypothetical protein
MAMMCTFSQKKPSYQGCASLLILVRYSQRRDYEESEKA